MPVLWIVISTIFIIFLTNLPLLYGYIELHGTNISKLWGYAPHQFVFLLVPLPIATFATVAALTIILHDIQSAPTTSRYFNLIQTNWIAIILFGIILSCTISIFDYYSSPKVIDRLKPEHAQHFVTAAEEIRNRDAVAKDRSTVEALQRQANDRFKSIQNDTALTVESIKSVSADVYVRIATDAHLQRRLQLLDSTAHLLSQLQLAAALFVGFAALFATTLIFLSSFSTGINLSNATPSVIVALAFFSLYVVCYAYWSSEVSTLTGRPINNVGFLFVGGLILFLGLALAVSDTQTAKFTESVLKAIPAAFAILSLAAVTTAGTQNLRIIIGIDASAATRLLVLITIGIIGLICCTMIVVQYESSLPSNRNRDA